MDVAFHFLAELHGSSYGLAIEEVFFNALLGASDPGGRIEFRVGDLLLHRLAQREEKTGSGSAYYHDEEREALALQEWLSSNMPTVLAVDEMEARTAATSSRVFVIAALDMESRTVGQVDAALRLGTSYIGCIEIYEESRVHDALYMQLLPLKYSYENRRLCIFFHSFEPENRGERAWLVDHWRSRLFVDAGFEDLGTRDTIFEDPAVVDEMIESIRDRSNDEDDKGDPPDPS